MKKVLMFCVIVPFFCFGEVDQNKFKGPNYETFTKIYERYSWFLGEANKIRNKGGPTEPMDYERYSYCLGRIHAYDECLENLFPGIWITDNVIYDMTDFIED